MGKLDQAAEALAKGPRTQEKLADTLLRELDEEDSAALRGWLEDGLIGHKTLSRALKKAGVELGCSAIKNWRDEHGIVRPRR